MLKENAGFNGTTQTMRKFSGQSPFSKQRNDGNENLSSCPVVYLFCFSCGCWRVRLAFSFVSDDFVVSLIFKK